MVWVFECEVGMIDVERAKFYVFSATFLQASVPYVFFELLFRALYVRWMLDKSRFTWFKSILWAIVKLHHIHRHALFNARLCKSRLLSSSWRLPLSVGKFVQITLLLQYVRWYGLCLQNFCGRLATPLSDLDLVDISSSIVRKFRRDYRRLWGYCLANLRLEEMYNIQ